MVSLSLARSLSLCPLSLSPYPHSLALSSLARTPLSLALARSLAFFRSLSRSVFALYLSLSRSVNLARSLTRALSLSLFFPLSLSPSLPPFLPPSLSLSRGRGHTLKQMDLVVFLRVYTSIEGNESVKGRREKWRERERERAHARLRA
jgi:hypothetical protein